MDSPSIIELNETFQYSTANHAYTLRWTSIGDPTLPALVLIHGTPWSSYIWFAHAQALSSLFHIYLFDNPGFGASPRGQIHPGKQGNISKEAELDANFSQESEIFAALYKHWKASWGSKDAHIVAHSSGGLMSLRAFILHDCQFLSLYLVNVAALGSFRHPYFERFKERESFFQSLTLEDFDSIVASFIRDSASSKLNEEIIKALKAPWVINAQGNEDFVRQMVRASQHNADGVEHMYPEVGIRIPVRIAWGEEDRWNHVLTASKIREKLNAKEVFLIDGAGHLVMLDKVIELGVDIRRWLEQQQ
ncbi:hypothetical protein N7540_011513 [Penicillium herquei]|nr:hypothetical protein N7540_011513 [Penicillium herquei]